MDNFYHAALSVLAFLDLETEFASALRKSMEPIWQAVERAKAKSSEAAQPRQSRGSPHLTPSASLPRRASESIANHEVLSFQTKEVQLDRRHLEAHRIIAHNVADPRSRSFDMLRTQVLQSMDRQGWQFLAITSPTAGCGKTVTSINLALSIARQSERSVLLVDMDLPRPQVANYLGLDCQQGLLDVLEGRETLPDVLVNARVSGHEVLVLPVEASTVHSSELVASRAMRTTLQDIKANFPSRIVIFDLPPALSSDDVIAFLPHVDCTLLVAAVGISTQQEIKECNRLLQSSQVVRLVLNKASESTSRFYY